MIKALCQPDSTGRCTQCKKIVGSTPKHGYIKQTCEKWNKQQAKRVQPIKVNPIPTVTVEWVDAGNVGVPMPPRKGCCGQDRV